LIIAALAAAYFVVRSQPPTGVDGGAVFVSSGSPKAVPSVESAPARLGAPSAAPARAAEHDAHLAFERLRTCAYASRELAATNSLSSCKEFEGRPDFHDVYAQCLNGWMNVPNRKVAAETSLREAGCGDTTGVTSRYFEATKQAARAGDAEAQICYLEGEFGTSDGEPLFTRADEEEYDRVAPRYVDAALHRGDWRIVELMTKDSFHPGVEPIRQIPDIGKPETIYKMKKLLRLGASGSYAESLQLDLEGMIHPDLNPDAALPPDVVKRGDAWAQQTFNEYFSGLPGLTDRPTVCMSPLGKIDRLPGPTVAGP
jgi:hypothetical protein